MSNKRNITNLLLILISVCCMFLAYGASVLQMNSAKAEILSLPSFTYDGASIKYDSNETGGYTSGIRFKFSIDKGDYTALGETPEFGVIIARGSFTDAADAKTTLIDNVTKKPCTDWHGTYNPSNANAQEYIYTVAVTDIADANFGKAYAIVGYIKTTTNIYYTDCGIASPFLVALSYRDANQAMGEEAEFINSAIDNGMQNKGIILDKETYTAKVGDTVSVTATIDGREVNPIFSVPAENGVAEIENNQVKVVGYGSTTITATISGTTTNSITKTATLQVADLEADNGIIYGFENGEYYVAGASDVATGKITIPATYDDGVNGSRAVTALGKNCFLNNEKITHLTLPSSVTVLKDSCCFGMSNLEYVYVSILKTSGDTENANYGTNQFYNCKSLKTLIIDKTIDLNTNVFGADDTSNDGGITVYAKQSGGSIAWLRGGYNQMLPSDWVASIYNEKVTCGSNNWKYGDDEYTIVEAMEEHNYVDGKCENCSVYDTQGVTYAYDSVAGSYYVSSGASATGVVRVLPKYTDGTTAELPVTYLADSAFRGNANITHVILPESVTKMGKTAFMNASNLVLVEMPGISEINAGANTGGDCEFLNCSSLKTIIITQTLTVGQQVFPTGSKTVQAYALQSGGSIIKDSTIGTGGLNTTVITYDQDAACGSGYWKYAENGYDVVVPEHIFDYENYTGVCKNCGEYDTQNVVYEWNGSSYTVTDGKSAKGVVRILPEYDDGEHGKAAVTALGNKCFSGNTNLTALILPVSVTSIGLEACYQCGALKLLYMPGVTGIASGNHHFAFTTLTKLIINKDLNVTAQATFANSSKPSTMQVYVEQGGGNVVLTGYTLWNGLDPIVYDAEGGANSWHWNEDKSDIVIVPVA